MAVNKSVWDNYGKTVGWVVRRDWLQFSSQALLGHHFGVGLPQAVNFSPGSWISYLLQLEQGSNSGLRAFSWGLHVHTSGGTERWPVALHWPLTSPMAQPHWTYTLLVVF